MKKKLKKVNVRATSPLYQDVEIQHRYDKEWKTNFISITSCESSALGEKGIGEELTVCFNTKKEFDQFITALKAMRGNFK